MREEGILHKEREHKREEESKLPRSDSGSFPDRLVQMERTTSVENPASKKKTESVCIETDSQHQEKRETLSSNPSTPTSVSTSTTNSKAKQLIRNPYTNKGRIIDPSVRAWKLQTIPLAPESPSYSD